MSVRIRYSTGFLLAVLALIAVTLTVFRHFDWHARSILVLIASWAACGFAGGWLAARTERNRVILPSLSFTAFNWLLWYWNREAVKLAEFATTYHAEGLELLIEAENAHMFDLTAILFTLLLVVAAWRKDSRFLWFVGGLCCSFWFVVVSIGYLMACASLPTLFVTL